MTGNDHRCGKVEGQSKKNGAGEEKISLMGDGGKAKLIGMGCAWLLELKTHARPGTWKLSQHVSPKDMKRHHVYLSPGGGQLEKIRAQTQKDGSVILTHRYPSLRVVELRGVDRKAEGRIEAR